MGLLKKVEKKPLRSTGRGGGGSVSALRPQQTAKRVPCTTECPSGTHIREWVQIIAQREKTKTGEDEALTKAWLALVETNPFPAVTVASDGKLLLHPYFSGKYPLFRFIGMTASRDLPFLKFTSLGNVAPVVRLESFYAYKNTFSDFFSTPPSYNIFKKFDEVRAAMGIDWKVRIRPLNERAYFFISPQIYYRWINLSGPQDWYDTAVTKVGKNNWTGSLYLNTLYLNAKLTPSFFWLHDFYYRSDMFKLQMTYDWSSSWRFTLGALLFSAKDLIDFKTNNSFDLFTNKNQLFFKITYKWQ